MMEISAQPGEGGRCTPTPFHHTTITYRVAVYTPAERADTLPLFLSTSICTLWFESPKKTGGFCYITMDFAMAASQNRLCSTFKLSLHKKTNIINYFLLLLWSSRETRSIYDTFYTNTALWCGRCKIHRTYTLAKHLNHLSRNHCVFQQGLVERVWYQKVHPSPANFPVVSLSNYAWKSFFPIQKEFLCIFWNFSSFFLRHSRNKLCEILHGTITKTKIFVSTLLPGLHDSRTLYFLHKHLLLFYVSLTRSMGIWNQLKTGSNHWSLSVLCFLSYMYFVQ